jgi:glycosyltransferase involved in cell wall biosynthesis
MIPLFWRFPRVLNKASQGDRNAIFLYHRIEPLAFTQLPAHKHLLCFHGNPDEIVGNQSEVRWRFLPGVYRRFERKAMEKASRVWVVSRKGQAVLQERYPEKQPEISFLPTWYRNDLFAYRDSQSAVEAHQALVKRFGGNAQSQFVLFAGRWERQKNPELAVDAFCHAAGKRGDLVLVMAGGGSLEPRIHERVRKRNLQDRVVFPGTVTPPELSEIMQGCQCLLSTSAFEGLPVVVLEAMASGLPVVSTQTGEIRKIVREGVTGRVVENEDPHVLGEALLDIFNSTSPYDPRVCANAASMYQPNIVLESFFEEIRKIAASE